MNGRERILALFDGKKLDHLPFMPITMQFACRQIKARYRDYCADYRVLVEGQVKTAEAFGIDYVNIMSDPAREAADFGAEVEAFDDQPVSLVEERALLSDKGRLAGLKLPDPLGGGRMHNAIRALQSYKRELLGSKLIEGWIEGPCAEAADLRGINNLMVDFLEDPDFVKELFEKVTALGLRYAEAQVKAGADCIGIGDAAASLVGPRIYEEFVRPCEERLVAAIRGMGARVRLHICGNTRRIMKGMAGLHCDLIDVDSLTPLDEARLSAGPGQAFVGNISPVEVMRNGGPEAVLAAVAACHRQAGERFIVGAGCEMPPDTPEANLRALGGYALAHHPSDF